MNMAPGLNIGFLPFLLIFVEAIIRQLLGANCLNFQDPHILLVMK